MKTCSSCKKDKPFTDFYKKTATKQQSMCKSCFNSYCTERWKQKKLDAITYKGGSCISCGYDKYHGALEFHHRDPNSKDYDWGKLRLLKHTTIIEELDKCDLLCSNCHREVHAI